MVAVEVLPNPQPGSSEPLSLYIRVSEQGKCRSKSLRMPLLSGGSDRFRRLLQFRNPFLQLGPEPYPGLHFTDLPHRIDPQDRGNRGEQQGRGWALEPRARGTMEKQNHADYSHVFYLCQPWFET